MSKDHTNLKAEEDYSWTTWEELLLACAVKRHGFKKWELVAMEVQTRSSLPNLVITAEICQQKYHELRRRFTVKDNSNNKMIEDINNETDSIPWLEDLRKLRVAELKLEVQRYDVSILALQSKVKRLENACEQSLKENDNSQAKPDLDDSGEERSETDKNDKCEESVKPETEQITGKSFSGENLSVNGSNSTAAKGENREICEEDEHKEEKPVQTGSNKPDLHSRHAKAVVEDSCNGSSEPNRTRKDTDSDEVMRDSVTQSKESSDVQSSASLTRKEKTRRRKGIGSVDNGGEEPLENEDVNPDHKLLSVKSQPLISVLEAIRSHKHGSLFERRLKSQESESYKDMVKQHMDLETVKTRIEQGSYSSSDDLNFYRDLYLIFNNAIAYFSKSSLESITAHELRSLVSEQMHKLTQGSISPPDLTPSPPISLPKSDSLLAKHKSSVPILVCRKRSSMSNKPSSASLKVEEKKKAVVDTKPVSEEQTLIKEIESKEKTATGSRSLRRNSNKKITNPPPPLKTEKRKNEEVTNEKKKSAADFLKRIKRNSPPETVKNNGEDSKKKANAKGSENKGNERVLRQNGGGGRKVNKDEGSPSKKNVGRPVKKGAEPAPKRGREGGGKEVAAGSKRPKKRSRR